MAETTGERFRRLGDELRELTGGEHYFIGGENRSHNRTFYNFSFGGFYNSAAAQAELDERLRLAREAKNQNTDS